MPDPDARPATHRKLTPWEAVALPSLRNATFALLIAVLAAAGAASLSLQRAPVYQSRTTILLDHPDVARVPDSGPILRLNALRRKYAALVPTEEIAGRVAEKVELSHDLVARLVTVQVGTDSLVMYPVAQTRTKESAKVLAAAVTDELVAYAEREQVAANVPRAERVTLKVVDHADDGAKISPTNDDAVIAAVLAGGVGMAAAYVLLQLATAGRRISRARW